MEVNGRLGGIGVPELTALAGGPDLLRQALLLGLDRTLEAPPFLERVAFRILCQPPPSARRVRTVDGLEAARKLPGVADVRLNRPPGSVVDWREGTVAHVYHVDGMTDDHAEAFRLRDAVLQTVKVRFD